MVNQQLVDLHNVYHIDELCAPAPGKGVILGSVGEQLQNSRRRDMTIRVTQVSLVALLALLCTFTISSVGTARADNAPDSGVDSAKVVDKSLPSPDEFIAVDISPVLENQPPAVYPDSAKKANIKGSVWVKVLVDKQGSVKRALIAKASGKKVGFEEAALAAAKQATWKPAMLDKKPVAIWVSYEIKFAQEDEK
jgi:TonB family protein